MTVIVSTALLMIETGGTEPAMSNRSSARRAKLLSVLPAKTEPQAPELLSGKSSAMVLSITESITAVAACVAETPTVSINASAPNVKNRPAFLRPHN